MFISKIRLHMKFYFATLITVALSVPAQTSFCQNKILFDASKAEMAGNADWVIDADQTNIRFGSGGNAFLSTSGNQSNPQSIPTPPQSGITASTPETYWMGGISSWAVDLVKKGFTVETLPWNGEITYGNTSNPQDLSNYKVYIVDEPNIKFSATEQTAMMRFVQNGGGLFMIADHDGADRNWDGWGSPQIWNDFFTNNGIQANPFGITFDYFDFSGTSTAVATTTDSLLSGSMGTATRVYFAGGTSMKINTTANSTVKGSVFRNTASRAKTDTGILVASARYGRGKVAALGDSSPTDDSTGNPTCTLYDGYWGDALGNHRPLLVNTVIWLASGGSTSIEEAVKQDEVSIYPNPNNGQSYWNLALPLHNTTVTVMNMTGTIIAKEFYTTLEHHTPLPTLVNKGLYIVKLESDKISTTARLIVY